MFAKQLRPVLGVLSCLCFVFNLSGCATQEIPVAQLGFTQNEFNVKVRGNAVQRSVGFLPVRDERPQAEKSGEKPGAVYLLVWNSRVGDYVTGDQHVSGNLTEEIKEGLKASFDKANLFREIKDLVPKNELMENELTRSLYLAQAGAGYVLDVAVTHAYATQYQNSTFAVIPTPVVSAAGWTDGLSLPSAECELYLRLYETSRGHLVWEDQVRGLAPPEERGDMAQAFRGAVRRAIEISTDSIYNAATSLDV